LLQPTTKDKLKEVRKLTQTTTKTPPTIPSVLEKTYAKPAEKEKQDNHGLQTTPEEQQYIKLKPQPIASTASISKKFSAYKLGGGFAESRPAYRSMLHQKLT
jgi:hypothetical protein